MTKKHCTLLEKWLTVNLAAVDRSVSSGALKLLLRLAWHLNGETGQCNPSQETLSEALGFSTRTVRKHTRELEAAGYIKTRKGREIPPRTHYSIDIFRGDRTAYSKAELMRINGRKKPSGKHMNEHMNKREARKTKITPYRRHETNGQKLSKNDEIRDSLEKQLLKAFSCEEEGWSAMTKVSEDTYLECIEMIGSGQLTLAGAVELILAELLT